MSTKPEEKLHIGIDFDNTIVKYDDAFYHQALRLGLIKKGTKKVKQAIRDAIRRLPHGNDKWTELQGIVYGLHMNEARLIDGVGRFLQMCRKEKVKVSIISQKTMYPAMGPRVSLRAAARKWLERNKFISKYGLKEKDIVFEETIAGKIARINAKGCTHFIDDLPEILLHKDFPKSVGKVLFSNDNKHDASLLRFKEWREIKDHFFPNNDPEVKRAAADLLWQASMEKIIKFSPLKGAFNCSVFKAVSNKGNEYIIKKYLLKKNDKRDRLATEFNGLSFLWSNGLRSIPCPIAADKSKQVAIYSFVNGKKVRANGIKRNDVLSAVNILGRMRHLSSNKLASEQPIASEACFSINSHIAMITKRMKRLGAAKGKLPVYKDMHAFIRTELGAYLKKVRKFIDLNSSSNERKRKLIRKEMFISPSDVGFHNILKDGKGRIFFIDFEYYGWDDPAKAISDFYLQPDAPLPVKYRREFFNRIMRYFRGDKNLIRRLPFVYALLSVKWCQIILNAFLNKAKSHDRIILKRQLVKARMMLRSAKREFGSNSFPLSLAKEAVA